MAHDQCDAGPTVSFQPEISLASTELYCLVHKARVGWLTPGAKNIDYDYFYYW